MEKSNLGSSELESIKKEIVEIKTDISIINSKLLDLENKESLKKVSFFSLNNPLFSFIFGILSTLAIGAILGIIFNVISGFIAN